MRTVSTIIINSGTLNTKRGIQPVLFDVPKLLSDLENEYPDFNSWYFNKVIPGIFQGDRCVVLKQIKEEFVGIAILKRDRDERKICTLRVTNNIKGNGIGSALITDAISL